MPLFLFQSHYQNFNPTLCQPIPLFLVYIYYPTITLLVYTQNDVVDFRKPSQGRSCIRRSTKAPRTMLARKLSLSGSARLVRLR